MRVSPRWSIEFDLAVRTRSLTNTRGHWGKKAQDAKRQRWMVAMAWRAHGGRPLGEDETAVVTFTRRSAQLLDSDNIHTAFKALRDGIAACFGVDDRDPRVKWDPEPKQELCRRGAFSVRIGVQVFGHQAGEVHA